MGSTPPPPQVALLLEECRLLRQRAEAAIDESWDLLEQSRHIVDYWTERRARRDIAQTGPLAREGRANR